MHLRRKTTKNPWVHSRFIWVFICSQGWRKLLQPNVTCHSYLQWQETQQASTHVSLSLLPFRASRLPLSHLSSQLLLVSTILSRTSHTSHTSNHLTLSFQLRLSVNRIVSRHRRSCPYVQEAVPIDLLTQGSCNNASTEPRLCASFVSLFRWCGWSLRQSKDRVKMQRTVHIHHKDVLSVQTNVV